MVPGIISSPKNVVSCKEGGGERGGTKEPFLTGLLVWERDSFPEGPCEMLLPSYWLKPGPLGTGKGKDYHGQVRPVMFVTCSWACKHLSTSLKEC